MPFVSKAQSRACWAKYRTAVNQGQVPEWDCHEWAGQTNYKKLPEKSKSKNLNARSKSPKPRRNSTSKSRPKKPRVYTGPRGGKYIISKSGNKIYIS